jgi:hypothetical protein
VKAGKKQSVEGRWCRGKWSGGVARGWVGEGGRDWRRKEREEGCEGGGSGW